MKCPICSKRAPPGAKLCAPCRAALKRAKDDSVWELPPGKAPALATPADQAPAAPRWVLGGRLSGWRGLAVGVAALSLAAGVFATVRLSHADPDADLQAAATVATVDLPPAAPTNTGPPSATRSARAAESAATVPAFVDDPVEPPRSHERIVRPPKAVKPAAEPTPSAPLSVPEPVAAPPALPALVERAPAPRVVDPWQRMADALARCAGDSLFARLGCEHRVRAAYCEGSWGQVAQCPAGIPNDHGQ